MEKMTYVFAELFFVVVFIQYARIAYGQENSCELPKKIGSCNAKIKRWYFNINQGKCQMFIYSGCDGNPNNFKTKSECKKACNDRVCRLPKNIGQCSLSQTRWYYNINAMMCQQFIYTGCQGNKNRFPTKKKCNKRCKGVKTGPCPPPTPCARPLPDQCVAPYRFFSGVRCEFGCVYPPCKPGNCPTTPPSSCTQCTHSVDCSGSLICCEGCCRNPVIDPKRGSCPTTGLLQCVGSSPECSLDSECPGERKCCLINNAKCCVDPDV